MSTLAPTPTAPTTRHEPPMIERLAAMTQASWVDPQAPQRWCEGQAHAVLLLAGDAVRFPEGQDVAAVLPELLKATPTACQVGVVRREDEDQVARRFGSQRWPSLVFFRDGQYATVLPGMHDWDVYTARFSEALAAAPSRAPTIGIPVVSAQGASACGPA